MKLSIGRVLIGALVGLQLTAVSIFIYSSYLSTEQALTDHARILMKEAAGNVIESSKSLLSPPQDAAQLTKRLLKSSTIDFTNRQALAHYMFEQLRVSDQLSGIYYGTPSGDFFNVQLSDEKGPGGYKSKIITNVGGARKVEVIWHDSNFNIVATADDPTDLYDPRQRPWYIKAVAERSAIWTDPYIFFTAREPGVTSAIPVYGDDRRIIAVVGVDVKITRFSQFLKTNWSTDDGGAFIVSTDGTLVATPELANGILLQGSAEKPQLPNVASSGSPVTLAASNALKASQKDIDANGNIFTSFDVDGRTYFAMFASFDNQPWSVGIYGSEQHYLGVLKDNQFFNLMFAFAIGVISSFIGFLIARKISKPIKQLGQVAHAVSRDGLQASIDEVSRSPFREIQDTTDAFSRMMKDLKAAEKSKQALSVFISSMAHELRTPMTAIIGFSQMMQASQNEPLSKQQNEFINIILESANHQIDLINQVLDLAKIQSGTRAPSLGVVNPREVISQCIDFLKFLAEKKRIKVEFYCDGMTAPNVLADHGHLKQAMLNLISNAIKFNRDEGFVKIWCEAAETPGFLKILVSDNGAGIPMDRIGEIFEPFNRLDFETSAVEGTGIGLSITKELVELMGGEIGVESTPGEGTTFWIEMPLIDSDAEHAVRCDKRDDCAKRSVR